jgi:hypothetical protein
MFMFLFMFKCVGVRVCAWDLAPWWRASTPTASKPHLAKRCRWPWRSRSARLLPARVRVGVGVRVRVRVGARARVRVRVRASRSARLLPGWR